MMTIIAGEVLNPFHEIVNGVGMRADLYLQTAGNLVEKAPEGSVLVDVLFVAGLTGAFLALAVKGVEYVLNRYGLLDENDPGDSSFYNEDTDTYNFPDDSHDGYL